MCHNTVVAAQRIKNLQPYILKQANGDDDLAQEQCIGIYAALKENLPKAEYTLPEGGFFFWVRIPDKNSTELRSRAKDFGVDFRQRALFSADEGMQEYMRLCFAFYDADTIRKGIERLGRYLE